MLVFLPTTDLMANPHLDPKIKYWKKVYACIYTALSTSGISWNNTTKIISIDDENVWNEYCEDQATSEGAEAPGYIIEEMEKDDSKARIDIEYDTRGEGFEEMQILSTISSSSARASDNKTHTLRKRSKSNNVFIRSGDNLSKSIDCLINSTSQQLGAVIQRIVYDQGLSKMRRKVFGIIMKFSTFTPQQKVNATK
ncbi:uncharacterized protein A4U43_C09F6220 [Asparagus officinalis]|uniref:Myb/SANT-like domain-containing protein n=1 Tax=Asparagus officinalis TaxID=4686 RepID=A0A5P1E7G8_ASPOF|nr:uncharacterized protein A4U43_C09F6220 [Asparagus officinalis]